jgi:2-polyprenyl-3-methyl-5-hydroxy-6-metoxy-1,4-benzoquinol methylase
MDEITQTLKEYYTQTFETHGATAKGVDWGDEHELLVRYDKMLGVLQKDFMPPACGLSLLDVGCGWGGLLRRARQLKSPIVYSGIDVVESMILYGREEFPDAEFIHGDVFEIEKDATYDFVVCNAILTQKLSVTNIEMERFSRQLIRKMFALCRHGIAFNMMSTRVNYTVNNLYYQNPVELLSWLLSDISPRVRLDHGYSSLASGKGKFYDFTVYVYKD